MFFIIIVSIIINHYHYFKQTCSEYETTPPPTPTDTRKYALCMSTHTQVHTYMSTHQHTHTSTCTHSHKFTQTQNVRPTHPVVIGVGGANLDPSLVDSGDGVGAD